MRTHPYLENQRSRLVRAADGRLPRSAAEGALVSQLQANDLPLPRRGRQIADLTIRRVASLD
jgi:hypothetical protein